MLPVLAFGAAACGNDEEQPAAAEPNAAEMQTQNQGEDIVALAQGNEELSTLVDAVTAADLDSTLQGEGPFTVFAPTDAAFAAVGEQRLEQLLEPESREQLTGILAYHVVEGELMASDLEDGQQLTTVNGDTLSVRVDGDRVRVGDATVVIPDVDDASNGVVHVIDAVLLPDES